MRGEAERFVRDRVVILGIGVDRLSLDETVERIASLIELGGQHQVVTVNPEFLIAARYQPAFAHVLCQASVATADGIGVVLAARLLGRPVPGRVTGTDVLPLLARRCAAAGWSLFLLGALPGVAEEAAAALRRAAPGVCIAGTYAGSPSLEDEPTVLACVQAARPDILLVAYGAPQQDLWIARNLKRTPVRVAIGVGGAFDFLSGRKPRAPALLRRAGLEWAYRLWREPWRAKRMLALPAFAVLVLRDVVRRHVLVL